MKPFLLLAAILFAFTSHSQELTFISFSNASSVQSFAFRSDQKAVVKVTVDGQVIAWGQETDRYLSTYYPGKLEAYPGRVELYGPESDSVSRGKLKSIGYTFITYYPATERPDKAGKVQTIGRTVLDYYDAYENVALRGKLKSAGLVSLTYYNSFENESVAGKLKSVDATTLVYHTSFDDKLIRGKIKSIGNNNYSWYTSNSSTGYQGALKSGNIAQLVNGITYVIF